MTYDEITALSEKQAKALSLEVATIKGHTCYFVDFKDRFGFSVLVFKNNHHIHYCDDFQLHYDYYTKECTTLDEVVAVVKPKYIEKLNGKLYTEEEILSPIKDYDDFHKKEYYLHNYYHMAYDYVSAIYIDDSRGENRKEIENKKKKLGCYVYDPFCWAYVKDEAFVKHHAELIKKLIALKDGLKDNYEYWFSAFKYEMWNHEYPIGLHGQKDWDVLSAFGNVKWDQREEYGNLTEALSNYFDQLKFSDTQRKAYYDARAAVLKEDSEAV